MEMNKKRAGAWIQALVGFLVGRIWIFGFNPFAVSFFVLGMEAEGGILVPVSILLGIASTASPLELTKYMIVLLILYLPYVGKKEREHKKSVWFRASVLAGLVTMGVGYVSAFMTFERDKILMLSSCEGLLVFLISFVVQAFLQIEETPIVKKDYESIFCERIGECASAFRKVEQSFLNYEQQNNPDILTEWGESLAAYRVYQGVHSKMDENRRALMQQMGAMAKLLTDMVREFQKAPDVSTEEKKKVLKAIKRAGFSVKDVNLWKDIKGHKNIIFLGKTRRGNGRECFVALLEELKDELQVSFRLVDAKDSGYYYKSGNNYERIELMEEPKFQGLTGMARVAKSGEATCGDNYSFLHLSTGEIMMILSDGMGSGELAGADSECMVEVLEHLIEAGFQNKTALSLLNALFVMSYQDQNLTTLDVANVDLYSGTLQLMKHGGAATFLKRGDQVELIYGERLPIGAMLTFDYEKEDALYQLEDEDLIILVTDGILDAFPGDDKESYVINILLNCHSTNPNDIAGKILMGALENCGHIAMDDMSVLVLGVFLRH